jgi:hypothetical protein
MKLLPDSDSRARRYLLEKDDFALASGEYEGPTNLIEEDTWRSIVTLLGVRQEQERPGIHLRYSEQEFQEMVSKALDDVPEEFDKEWRNVALILSTN